MKRLVAALVVVLALLVVADRVAAAYASRALADEVGRTAALGSAPDVDITGFPFLTQALSGRYDRVDVRATDVPAGEDLVVSVLEVTLRGVQVPLADVLSQTVDEVPADRLAARALLSYDGLSQRYGGQGVVVEADGDRLRITGELEVAGQTLSAVARSRVEVDDGDLLVSTEEVGLAGGEDDEGEDASSSALSEALELRLPVQDLPYGLVVTAAEVRPDGVSLEGEADDVVLETR